MLEIQFYVENDKVQHDILSSGSPAMRSVSQSASTTTAVFFAFAEILCQAPPLRSL